MDDGPSSILTVPKPTGGRLWKIEMAGEAFFLHHVSLNGPDTEGIPDCLVVELHGLSVAGHQYRSSMDGDVIRFAVGVTDGPRSATWRVWKHRTADDVYVAPRRITGHFKASLHKDGTWLFGFSEQHTASPTSIKPSDQPRQRRFSPSETKPGLVRAVSVFIPESEVVVPSYGGSETGSIYWHPRPAESRMAAFTVSFTSPGIAVKWSPDSMSGPKLVGSIRLSNGAICWVTVQDQDVPRESADAWAARKEALRFQRRGREAEPFDVRAIGHDVLNDDGSFYFVDLFWQTPTPADSTVSKVGYASQ